MTAVETLAALPPPLRRLEQQMLRRLALQLARAQAWLLGLVAAQHLLPRVPLTWL